MINLGIIKFLDIRKENSLGQSINLALSVRGREALRAVDLEDTLVKCHGSCMRGRMLHDKNGNLKEILYDSVKGNVSLCSLISNLCVCVRAHACVCACVRARITLLYAFMHINVYT